jgi:hypothetical protein
MIRPLLIALGLGFCVIGPGLAVLWLLFCD